MSGGYTTQPRISPTPTVACPRGVGRRWLVAFLTCSPTVHMSDELHRIQSQRRSESFLRHRLTLTDIRPLQIVARGSAGGVATPSATVAQLGERALRRSSGSEPAEERRAPRSAVGEVELPLRPPKPRATQRDRELQGDAGRPHASNGTHQASSPRPQNVCGSDPRSPPSAGSAATSRAEGRTAPSQGRTAVRETERRKELVHSRPQRGSTHKRRKPKPRGFGLLVVVGHSGLEPEANGLRIHCSTN